MLTLFHLSHHGIVSLKRKTENILLGLFQQQIHNENTVEIQWLKNVWNHENMFEIGEVRANECSTSRGSNGYAQIDVRFPDKNDKSVQTR